MDPSALGKVGNKAGDTSASRKVSGDTAASRDTAQSAVPTSDTVELTSGA